MLRLSVLAAPVAAPPSRRRTPGSSMPLIFELASASGGSTALSSAEIYMGGSGGTRVQQACGFQDSTEDMFTYMMMAAGPPGRRGEDPQLL